MGSLIDAAEIKILDYYFGASANVTPSNWYVGLSTTTITDAGGNITEPSGNGYARKAASNNKTTFANAAAGSLSNAVALAFAAATGAGWGTVLDFFLADTLTGTGVNTIWCYGTLAASKSISSGDTPSFAIGAITITLD